MERLLTLGQGFSQTPGIDFDQTYAAIARCGSRWLVIQLTSIRYLDLC